MVLNESSQPQTVKKWLESLPMTQNGIPLWLGMMLPDSVCKA